MPPPRLPEARRSGIRCGGGQAIEYEQVETAGEHMIGFSVALTGIIVLLAMMGLEVRKIDRQLAEVERLLSVDDETANG